MKETLESRTWALRAGAAGATTWQDLRLGLRMLWKNPGFTAAAVLPLALGICACTAVFSVVNGVLLRALPYEEPQKLVCLWEDPSGQGRDKNEVAGAQFVDWRDQSTSLEELALVQRVNQNLADAGHPARLPVALVSAGYLRTLRLSPSLGRGFLPDEDQPGKDKVVVLAHGFWQQHFGGDTNVVGRTIDLGGESRTVVGVLPAAPRLPMECGALVPFVFGSEPWHRSRGDHRVRVIGRLKAGATLAQARTEMSAITQRLKPLYPPEKKDWGVTVRPMQEELTGAIRPQLWVLFCAAGFVLLIACANVAGLLLARMTARRQEIAVRVAVGAGRGRVIRQLLTESVLLSLLGGGLGAGLAVWAVRLFARLGAEHLPQAPEVGLDAPALGFALLTSLATGVAFGLAPALQLARPGWSEALKQGRRASPGGASGRLRGGLIVAEVALALILLTGAGLMLKTLVRLQAVPAGFNPQGVLAMDICLDDRRYPAGERRAAFLRQIVQRLETLPGVVAAGTATTLPMTSGLSSPVRAENRPAQNEFLVRSDFDFVSGDYFQTMGMPLVRGRFLNGRDDSTNAPRVAFVNQALASKVFPQEDPLGRSIQFNGQTWEIAGVVGDVRHRGLDRELGPHIYVPHAFSVLPPGWPCSLVVRASTPPLALAETLRAEILKLDPLQPVSNPRTMASIVTNAAGQRRLMLQLLGLFAGTAVVLAAIGLYGVMAYSVSQRAREIGIRMALGAQRSEVLRQFVGQGLKLSLAGVALGLLGAGALTRVLAHLLFGVTPQDPFTFGAVAAVLVAVALVACWLPARRAAMVDPVKSLRQE